MKIRAVGADLFHADTEMDTKTQPDEANTLINVRNFAEAPENVTQSLQLCHIRPKLVISRCDRSHRCCRIKVFSNMTPCRFLFSSESKSHDFEIAMLPAVSAFETVDRSSVKLRVNSISLADTPTPYVYISYDH